jgi:hypothetical protein
MQVLLQGLRGIDQAVVGALSGGGGVEGLDDSLMSVLQRSASAEMEGAGRMTGALPILSMGGGMNGLSGMHVSDDMRWEEVMPGFVDALMDDEYESAADDDEDEDDDSSVSSGENEELEGDEENFDDLEASGGTAAHSGSWQTDSSIGEATSPLHAEAAPAEGGADGSDAEDKVDAGESEEESGEVEM